MGYFPVLEEKRKECEAWLSMIKERDGDTRPFEKEMQKTLTRWCARLRKAAVTSSLLKREPSSLSAIRKLRPAGPRRLVRDIPVVQLGDKMLGAWRGRTAGCLLGIPAEGLSREGIRFACDNLGLDYPLNAYWAKDPKSISPDFMHYHQTPRRKFLKKDLKYAGADDDLVYTILGLLILEECGTEFTTADVAGAWLKYLPIACTAEHVALQNLKKGISAGRAGEIDNPYVDWIGADIRSDPWAYAAPGWPEKAAEYAHRDAFLSHRATGIHGEMFFSAAISAAFVVDDPIEALRIGLTEIPAGCRLAEVVRETLGWCRRDRKWDKTVVRIEKRFLGMDMAHTLNNAAITVSGLYYGDKDFEKTIALIVMSGVDTDCTAATAGSILGAILGARRLPRKWTSPPGDRVETYLKGKRWFSAKDIARRFIRIARL